MPFKTSSGEPRAQQEDESRDRGETLEFNEHNMKDLKRDRKLCREAIQKYSLFKNKFPKPMFNANLEECGSIFFPGAYNGRCARQGAHSPPKGPRKSNLLKYKDHCLK